MAQCNLEPTNDGFLDDRNDFLKRDYNQWFSLYSFGEVVDDDYKIFVLTSGYLEES